MKPEITQEIKDELLEFLNKSKEKDGITRREMQEIFGYSIQKMKDVIRVLLKEGILENVTVYREGIDGRMHQTPGYILRKTEISAD